MQIALRENDNLSYSVGPEQYSFAMCFVLVLHQESVSNVLSV